ncbi:tyrosine-type recombinase/integrase [Phytoactinopolyspora mesophila]|uniref:Tyrosine-type recombinase/integrase n=1 Tax=Phytoactinopolyspora mesophila TaxID=2650750 RepID=A0A7K3MB67_9ACTN|nr:hypothetical protein [Phytoactinopolyspora mesophila]NDL60561.1 tyrosine-type recombinase/integrase [Phytoactinopolyspora mesophila]
MTAREVGRAYVVLLDNGYAHVSVQRFRASLSAFFSWCVTERMIMQNPVLGTTVPKSSAAAHGMHPFNEDELEAVYVDAVSVDPWLADVMLVLGWTGVRWSELKALQPTDFVEEPHPALLVRRAQPDGVDVKATKSRRARRVPVADRVLPIVRERASNGMPWLFTTEGGHQLDGSNFRRSLWLKVNRGRRIHDLRHTAACLWQMSGIASDASFGSLCECGRPGVRGQRVIGGDGLMVWRHAS